MTKKKIYGTIVTTAAERKSQYRPPFPRVELPRDPRQETSPKTHLFSSKQESRILNFSVSRANLEFAKEEAIKAWSFFEEGKYDEMNQVVKELLPLYESFHTCRDPVYMWENVAYQMPTEMGIHESCKANIRRRLSSLSKEGVILEAFAGYNSFIDDSEKNHVIATDYCLPALERYPFPGRKRIQFDLNLLNGNNQWGDFEDETFDSIVLCCGYKYPRRIKHVLREFCRILKPSGVLRMVENPAAGFTQIVRRDFSKESCLQSFKATGFKEVDIQQILFSSMAGQYFLVEAKK